MVCARVGHVYVYVGLSLEFVVGDIDLVSDEHSYLEYKVVVGGFDEGATEEVVGID